MTYNLPQDPDDTGLIRVTYGDGTQIDTPIGQVLDFNAGERTWMWGTVVDDDLDTAA